MALPPASSMHFVITKERRSQLSSPEILATFLEVILTLFLNLPINMLKAKD